MPFKVPRTNESPLYSFFKGNEKLSKLRQHCDAIVNQSAEAKISESCRLLPRFECSSDSVPPASPSQLLTQNEKKLHKSGT